MIMLSLQAFTGCIRHMQEGTQVHLSVMCSMEELGVHLGTCYTCAFICVTLSMHSAA